MAKGNKLSPEAQKFVDAGRIRGRKRLKAWIPLLEELAEFDIVHEARSKRARTLGRVGLVLSVIMLFITAFISDSGSDAGLPVALALLSVALLIGSVVSFILAWHWKRWDLEDDARITLLPFLRFIADDIAPRGKISVWLPLVCAVDQKRLKRKKRVPVSRGKLTQTTFTAATGRISVPLIDGATVDLAIDRTYFLFVHSYWTTGRSGKMKHKTKKKWKVIVQVKAAVTPPGSKLEWDETAVPVVDGGGKIKFKEKEKGGRHIRAVVRTYKAKSVGTRPAFAVDGEDVLGMVMQLYSTLKAA